MTAVISANLGQFDDPVSHVHQEGALVTYRTFTDANMPPRPKALTSRLHARIPKMFGWDLCPGFDTYLWVDASFCLSRPDSVQWFLDQLGTSELAVFRHPERYTIREEAWFLRTTLAAGNHYVTTRYAGEDIDGQLAAVASDPSYVDSRLFASGAFCYRPTPRVTQALTAWWVHTSRFHCVDQLAFPFVTRECDVAVIDEDIFHATHIAWMRKHGHG